MVVLFGRAHSAAVAASGRCIPGFRVAARFADLRWANAIRPYNRLPLRRYTALRAPFIHLTQLTYIGKEFEQCRLMNAN
jgi:hypothetical protein